MSTIARRIAAILFFLFVSVGLGQEAQPVTFKAAAEAFRAEINAAGKLTIGDLTFSARIASRKKNVPDRVGVTFEDLLKTLCSDDPKWAFGVASSSGEVGPFFRKTNLPILNKQFEIVMRHRDNWKNVIETPQSNVFKVQVLDASAKMLKEMIDGTSNQDWKQTARVTLTYFEALDRYPKSAEIVEK